METVPDLARALRMAERLNAREGIAPGKPEARQAEAFGRIIREWASVALHSMDYGTELEALDRADWRCARCGATGLNSGGLRLVSRVALCSACG